MGIRINSTIAFGVQFTKEESKLYEKAIEGKHPDFLLMRWVEKALSMKSDRHVRRKVLHTYDCHYAYDFIKFTKQHKPVKPYKTFWDGWSEKKLAKTNIIVKAVENLMKHERLTEAHALEDFTIWEPNSDEEDKPPRILAIVTENNYAREVDYALVDHLKISGAKDKVIPVKGRYPWEAGTSIYKGKWITLNGQHMIPGLPEPLLHKILFHPGPKEDFIKLKKNIWDLHHGSIRPYQIYSGDGWWGTDFHFYPVDLLYQTVAKLVPGIKYDVMRLQKFLCFYWS